MTPAGTTAAPAADGSGPDVVVPRQAATMVILRAADPTASSTVDAGSVPGGPIAPIEVLLLRRSSRASFVAGAHVFPGGAVDAADRTGVEDHLEPEAAARLHRRVGDAAFAFAAIRECFEESGILFATAADGSTPSAEHCTAWRRDLAGGRPFRDLLRDERLSPDFGALWSWSRWVTPVGSPKRFDTRFFIAVAPPRHEATPDGTEITECVWMTPERAVALAAAGEMLLITPTRSTLSALTAFRTPQEAVGHVARLVTSTSVQA